MKTHNTTLRQRFGRLVVAALLACSIGGAAVAQSPFATSPKIKIPSVSNPAKTRLSKEQIAERLKLSTCWILGTTNTGTGWLVDSNQRLIITNYHVIEKMKSMRVFFPVKKDGEWVNEIQHYIKNVKPVYATLVHADKTADLAVLQVPSLPEDAVALKLADRSPAQGSQLHTLGAYTNGSSALWTYTVGYVRLVGNGRTALGGTTRIVEAQMEFNKGNSGGPIVNDFGELVAVVEGYRIRGASGASVRNVSVAIDVKRVKLYVNEAASLASPATAADFVKRGVGFAAIGRGDLAMRDYAAALQKDPQYAPAYAKRGWLYLSRSDYSAAMSEFDQALQIDSTLADAYHGRGRCLQAQKKYEDAISNFNLAIRYESNNGSHYNSRGICNLALGRSLDALEDFQKAVEKDPNHPVYNANVGYTALLMKKYKDAVAAYTKAIQLNGRKHEYYNRLGLAYLGLNDAETAAKAFAQANMVHKALTGNYSALYFRNLGVALQRGKKLTEAIAAYTKAIDLTPNNAELYVLRGKILLESGRRDLAAKDFQKAARMDPKQYGQLLKSRGETKTKRETPTRSSNSLVGVWRYKKSSGSDSIDMITVFAADGRYETRIVFTQNGKTQKYEETGTYAVNGDKVTLTSSKGEKVTRQFRLQSGQLQVYLPDQQTWLAYDRQLGTP